jgi:hypothetical protein
MNKILTFLIVAVIVYQSFIPLVKGLFRPRARKRQYKVDFSRKFEHLFAATLLLIIPVLCITSYIHLLPPAAQMALVAVAVICAVSASVSFYLYKNYVNKTPYYSLIHDPGKSTIELVTWSGRQTIPLSYVRGVEWHGIKKFLRFLPWSSFEYLVLELKNGKKLLIPSTIMAPSRLHHWLQSFEVVHFKRVFPAIK